MLIGGGGEKKTLRLVARHADIWHGFGDAEMLERKLAVLHQHCADVGRDRVEIEISVGVQGNPEELGPRAALSWRVAVHGGRGRPRL